MAGAPDIGWRRSYSQPICPHCENIELRRQGRVGLWQRVVLSRFGFYPWECGLCRRIFMLRQRLGAYASSAALYEASGTGSEDRTAQAPNPVETGAKNAAPAKNQATPGTGTMGLPDRRGIH